MIQFRLERQNIDSYKKELSLCHKLKCYNPNIIAPDGVNLLYFKLRLFDLTEFIQAHTQRGAVVLSPPPTPGINGQRLKSGVVCKK